jgi:hypothetical protein
LATGRNAALTPRVITGDTGVPPMDKKHPHERAAEEKKRHQDEALDHALEESFPGSDPVNLVQPPKSKKDKEGG